MAEVRAYKSLIVLLLSIIFGQALLSRRESPSAESSLATLDDASLLADLNTAIDSLVAAHPAAIELLNRYGVQDIGSTKALTDILGQCSGLDKADVAECVALTTDMARFGKFKYDVAPMTRYLQETGQYIADTFRNLVYVNIVCHSGASFLPLFLTALGGSTGYMGSISFLLSMEEQQNLRGLDAKGFVNPVWTTAMHKANIEGHMGVQTAAAQREGTTMWVAVNFNPTIGNLGSKQPSWLGDRACVATSSGLPHDPNPTHATLFCIAFKPKYPITNPSMRIDQEYFTSVLTTKYLLEELKFVTKDSKILDQLNAHIKRLDQFVAKLTQEYELVVTQTSEHELVAGLAALQPRTSKKLN